MGIFRYEISSPGVETLNMADAPNGWKDDESTFPRSETYKGIFRKFSANTLKFTGDGAAKLREIFAFNSFEAQGTFIVYEQDLDTYTEFIRFTGSFDFVEYQDIEDNGDGDSVEIIVIDSAFWNKIKNRESDKPQLSSLVGMDGLQITGFTNEETFVTLPSIPDQFFGLSSTISNSPDPQSGDHSVPAAASGNDTNNITVVDSEVIDAIDGAFYSVQSVLFEVRFDFNYNTEINIQAGTGGAGVNLILKRFNTGGGLVSSEILTSVTGAIGNHSLIFSGSRVFNPDFGDFFLLTVEGISGFAQFVTVDPYTSLTSINSDSEIIQPVQITGMLVHEAMSRELQITSNTDLPLWSDILGRIDSEPRSYAQNGILSEILLTNGERIRGFSRDVAPIVTGFKQLFTSLNAIYPIGAGVEKINGIDTLRIEDIKYFFDNRVVLVIEDPANIKRSVERRSIISRVSSGYKKAEYEEKEGRFEYNQKTAYSTPISVVDNEYNIQSEIRADDQGINNARAKNADEFPTEDTRYDQANFFVKVIKNNTDLLNGEFDDWSDDNTPDNWTINDLTVLRKTLLGSDRCYYLSGDGDILQNVVFAQVKALSIKFSFANIGASPVNSSFSVRLIATAETYLLQADGQWFFGFPPGTVTKINSGAVNPTPENELQSFESFSLITELMPDTGTLEFRLYSSEGYIVDNIYIGEPEYKAKTNEGYASISGAINGDGSYNLDITAARNFRNHGKIIRAGLENNLGKVIRFNNSDKNSTLSTRKDTETVAITETDDIPIIELDQPFFTPDKWEAEIRVDKAVIDVLNGTFPGETKRKYLGIVKIFHQKANKYIYLWIDDLPTGGQSGIGAIIGREVSKYVTIIEL